jgi:hypothetical protein
MNLTLSLKADHSVPAVIFSNIGTAFLKVKSFATKSESDKLSQGFI